jgi:hypothetical protein
MGDRASKALFKASLPREPQTYNARSKRSGVPCLLFIIVSMGDAQEKKKPKVNSILPRQKRKPSKRS